MMATRGFGGILRFPEVSTADQPRLQGRKIPGTHLPVQNYVVLAAVRAPNNMKGCRSPNVTDRRGERNRDRCHGGQRRNLLDNLPSQRNPLANG